MHDEDEYPSIEQMMRIVAKNGDIKQISAEAGADIAPPTAATGPTAVPASLPARLHLAWPKFTLV